MAPVARARAIVLWLLTVEVAVLAVTGVALYFAYEPHPVSTSTYSDSFASTLSSSAIPDLLGDLHRWAAWAAIPTAIVAAALLAVRVSRAERAAPGLALGAALLAAVVAAFLTGGALPWDQVAISTVSVGGNLDGYTWLQDSDVLFVVVGGSQVAPSTLLKWLVLHVVVLGGSLVVLLMLASRRTRREPSGPADAGAPSAEVSTGA